MPKQKPRARAKNFNEVALGYTEKQAMEEASRCIQCPKRGCVEGCPVEVDIPDFIEALREGNMPQAVHMLKGKNSLPGICGRVCPQESQCEATCSLAKKGAPIAIGRLERYVADWELAQPPASRPQVVRPQPTGKRVAVVGAGPAGLTAAADLAKLGHEVTIFEALHVSGGVLVYGIPEFRLPKHIVQVEVDYVKSLGVEIRLDWVVGKVVTVDEFLDSGYQAVFLGTGAGSPMFLDVPGENLSGIYSANEFLTRTNLMKAYLFPEYDTPLGMGQKVAVIGGGNVAMDSARCALRLGAREVYIVYRRSEAELPARHEEVENAQEEGIVFRFLANPTGFVDGRPWNASRWSWASLMPAAGAAPSPSRAASLSWISTPWLLPWAPPPIPWCPPPARGWRLPAGALWSLTSRPARRPSPVFGPGAISSPALPP
jgi:glutamate synthase (NADPH/NADH) small chain